MKKCIKLIVLLFITVLFILGLSGCGETKTSAKNNIATKTETKVNKEDNIQVEALGITANGDFAFKLINNNDEPVYIEKVEVIFKDENGEFKKKEEGHVHYFTIDSKSESINFVDSIFEDFSEYRKYEFKIKTSEDSMKNKYLVNGLGGKATPNNTAKQLAVTIQNNNDSEVNWVEIMAVYYKDGKVVGCKTGDSSDKIKKGENTYINIYYPSDALYNLIAFDDYEIYLMQATK